jgi:hypothetical protein
VAIFFDVSKSLGRNSKPSSATLGLHPAAEPPADLLRPYPAQEMGARSRPDRADRADVGGEGNAAVRQIRQSGGEIGELVWGVVACAHLARIPWVTRAPEIEERKTTKHMVGSIAAG